MNNKLRTKKGFSLIEVLLAIGTLAIGMIFVGGVFPVAIHFTTIATERTIAAVAADEAFAKIRLYGINLADPNLRIDSQVPFEDVTFPFINPDEFFYPSTNVHSSKKQYCWSALCRRIPFSTDVQVTVLVSRKIGAGTNYVGGRGRPIPWPVSVSGTLRADELVIEPGKKTFINDGYTIVDNRTGEIYRVLERYASPNDAVILLDRDWEGGLSGFVWVVPPPSGGGRYPCVAVYQKVIKF